VHDTGNHERRPDRIVRLGGHRKSVCLLCIEAQGLRLSKGIDRCPTLALDMPVTTQLAAQDDRQCTNRSTLRDCEIGSSAHATIQYHPLGRIHPARIPTRAYRVPSGPGWCTRSSMTATGCRCAAGTRVILVNKPLSRSQRGRLRSGLF
jgi:hypothetical protein